MGHAPRSNSHSLCCSKKKFNGEHSPFQGGGDSFAKSERIGGGCTSSFGKSYFLLNAKESKKDVQNIDRDYIEGSDGTP